MASASGRGTARSCTERPRRRGQGRLARNLLQASIAPAGIGMDDDMELLLRDLRHALASLLRRRGFAALTILVMALGLGASTAMFSVVHGVLFRPLPLPAPERLIDVGWTWQQWRVGMDDAQFRAFAEGASGFAGVAARTRASYTLAGDAGSERLAALHVSAGYFDVIGIGPRTGRGIGADEDRAGAEPVVVISQSLAQRLFAADAAPLGRTISLDGQPHTLVGVLPSAYADSAGVELYLPLAPVARSIGQGSNYQVLARLADDGTLAQAQQAFEALSARLWPERAASQLRIELMPYGAAMVREARAPLTLLSFAIALVLAIACANVANLLTVRAVDRRRELAVRSALGASSLRVQRLLLAEGLAIAVLGCLLGLGIAHLLVDVLLQLRPGGLPRADAVSVDMRAYGFSVLLALALGALTAIPAMLQTRRADVGAQLKSGATGTAAGGGERLRSTLVMGQVALAMMLSIGAGLLVSTFDNLLGVDPGFDPTGKVSTQFWSTGTRHRSSAEIGAVADALRARAAELPGARSAAVVAAGLPLERGGNFGVSTAGDDPDSFASTDFRAISPGYFATLGAPLLRGREFDARDGATSERVAIVNQAFVRTHLADQDPLGRFLHAADERWQIVAVAGDVRSSLDQESPPTVFLPIAQTPVATLQIFEGWFPMHLVVAGSGPEGALAEGIAQVFSDVDADLPVGRMLPMAAVHAQSVAEQRFRMQLMLAFAGFALLLAAIGIYGVLSHLVGRRTREIGIELALGARPHRLVGKVLRKGLRPALAGLALGIGGALYLTRFLEAFLFGVTPVSAPIYLAVAGVLSAAAGLAALVPALRAARVAPMVALRQE